MNRLYTNYIEYLTLSKKVKDIFIEKEEDNPSIEDWDKLGKPFVWILRYDNNDIKIWEDSAYGFISLQIGDERVIGRDIVSFKEYVCFGNYYQNYVEKTYIPYKLVQVNPLINNPTENKNDDINEKEYMSHE